MDRPLNINRTDVDLTIRVTHTRNLSEDVRSAVDHVCMAARLGEMTESLFQFLPPDGIHVMGYIEDEMVSHAVVTTRWLQVAEQPILKTAYIDAVSTVPKFQQRGAGSAVMRHLTGVIPNYEIGALQTERVPFYSRVGWEVWRGPLAGRKANGERIPTPDMGDDRVMIFRLPNTPELDLDSPLSIEYNGRIW
ncbi:MAG: GNAT family N-acetyltransferase [Chloroflexota bacterium]